MAFAKESEVVAGTKLVADGGFTCIPEGHVCEVKADKDGDLYVNCCGPDPKRVIPSRMTEKHYIVGELDDGNQYIGWSLAS